MAEYPDKWDYKLANVPGPLTAEMEARQKEKEREKRNKEKERKKAAAEAQKAQKALEEPPQPTVAETAKRLGRVNISKTEMQTIGMTPEQRARLDREKRALAAEARMKSQKNQCSACGSSLVGKQPFEKSVYKYCSMTCLQTQRLLFQ
jgi:HD-GYP domain-containing protein (c-di-GMP phosphodiesterase class II)